MLVKGVPGHQLPWYYWLCKNDGSLYSRGNQNHTYHPCSWWMNDNRSPIAFLETTIQVKFADVTCMPHLHEFLQILRFGDVPPTILEFWLKVKGKIYLNHFDKLEVCLRPSIKSLQFSFCSNWTINLFRKLSRVQTSSTGSGLRTSTKK